MFAAFGAELVTAKGDVNVRSDAVRQVLEYGQQLVKYLPDDAVSYDDASNNRALISGKSALIWNPPSAWAVAKRDAPTIAADCWTFPAPKGPKGRYLPLGAFSWGVWNFSPNKAAAKELIEFLSQRENVEARCKVVQGYDVPPFASMTDFKIWDEVGPPKGTVYHYPIRKSHHQENWLSRGPCPAGNRSADLQPRHAADDAGQASKRTVDQAGAGLGTGRTGRLRAIGRGDEPTLDQAGANRRSSPAWVFSVAGSTMPWNAASRCRTGMTFSANNRMFSSAR